MSHFDVKYQLTLGEGESLEQKIDDICLEQSVELPRSVLKTDIARNVVGRPDTPEPIAGNSFRVTISWPYQNLGGEISQLLNLLYGNISLKPGIRLIDIDWASLPEGLLKGPSHGITQLRDELGIHERPLSCTALKPMGTDTAELADYCYQFAAGGIDLIKDDHGLANQPTAPFEDRVQACVEALDRAERETGHRTRYYPNITAYSRLTEERYVRAAEMGADGVLLCPHIAGLGLMHELARSPIDLPIIAHPAFSGSLTGHPRRGFTPGLLYGGLWRAFGADFVIYPNSGGRFAFSESDCEGINHHARTPDSPYDRSFPMPGGGIKRENVARWLERYGRDTVFLIGGSLYEHPEGLRRAAAEFSKNLIEED